MSVLLFVRPNGQLKFSWAMNDLRKTRELLILFPLESNGMTCHVVALVYQMAPDSISNGVRICCRTINENKMKVSTESEMDIDKIGFFGGSLFKAALF